MKPTLIANWKMHGSPKRIEAFAVLKPDSAKIDVVLAPPAALLDCAVRTLGSAWGFAGQDCHWAQQGAYTGETSPALLYELGCSHVLIGHSERRVLMGETDEYVHDKILAAFEAGLTPIVCIGETLAQYQAQETFITLSSQLFHGLPRIAADHEVIVAYEPVWAIGSGLTPTMAEVQDAHDHIRTFLSSHWSLDKAKVTRILYGGSVKAENTAEILALPDVNGALIGGASLEVESFGKIIAEAAAL